MFYTCTINISPFIDNKSFSAKNYFEKIPKVSMPLTVCLRFVYFMDGFLTFWELVQSDPAFVTWRIVTEPIRAQDSSYGVSDQQNKCSSPGHDTCVPKTLNHYCRFIRMGRKAIGSVLLLLNSRKQTQFIYRNEKGFELVFLVWLAECCATVRLICRQHFDERYNKSHF